MSVGDRSRGHDGPRRSMRLMFDPKFGAMFWGKIFAILGIWTYGLVAAVVVFDVTQSALVVGLVGVVQFGPQLLLGPISGKWADVGNPARQILIGRALCTVGAGAVAILMFVRPDADARLLIGTIMGGSLVVGIGFVIGGPAMQSIVPSLIRDGELPTAMALSLIPQTLARIAGPALGAIVLAEYGAAVAFALSAVLNLVFVLLMALVTFPPPPTKPENTDYRVRVALRFVRRDQPLLLALIAVAAVGFASDPSITLAPVMAQELGGGEHLVGALSAAFGAGAAVSLILLAVWRGRVDSARVLWTGLWLLALGSAMLAASLVVWLAIAGFALAGVGFGAAMTGLNTVVQERAPDALRGRIMALWIVGFVGSRPLAAAVLGGSADMISVHAAFGVCACVVVVTAMVCRVSKLEAP